MINWYWLHIIFICSHVTLHGNKTLDHSNRLSTPSISHWFGRLGNCITQIIKAFAYAKEQHASVTIPDHSSPLLRNITNKTFSFGPTFIRKAPYFSDNISLKERCNVLKNHLIPLFVFPTPKEETQSRSIVIHLRNGDIWDTHGKVPWSTKQGFMKYFIQPPLEFYQAILHRHQDISTVVIIMDHDGTPSPILRPLLALLEKYQKKIVTYPHASVEEDFSSLAFTQNILVHSLSTLMDTAGLINYVATENSIQYAFKFIDCDHPTKQNLLAHIEDQHQEIANYHERIKVLLIGGEFGKRTVSLQRCGGKFKGNGDIISRPAVLELYTKPIPAQIYGPVED